MNVHRVLPLALLGACSSGPERTVPRVDPPPAVPVVVAWPEGTRFRATLAGNLPDEPPQRAARIWWREALRQSVAFELHDGDDRTLPALELSLDAAAGTLTASLREPGRERVLAGGRFAAGQLPPAIDALAWSARQALGETVEPPHPVGAGTSPHAHVVLEVDDAAALVRDGGFTAAERILRAVRARDGASPFVLDGLAALVLLRGDPAQAERIAREALGYEERVLPTTRHRLARTLLLARASADTLGAADHDRELLVLAEVGHRERPHDPEPLLTEALARNFLGEFERARTLLTDLQPRLPDQAIVDYHLGWACLGCGDAAAAVQWFGRASVRLPAPWVLLPRVVAMYEAGRRGELRDLVAALRAEAEVDHQALLHDLLRMQAADALLAGDAAAARAHVLATLNWLAKNPLVLARRVGEFAEQGAIAVRLGLGPELPPLLLAIQQQHSGSEIADVCTFVAGMVEVRARGQRLPQVEGTLARGGDSPWASLLAAWAHELRGEVADMQEALGRAAQLSDTPMTKALLARGLHASGRTAEASHLLATLRTEMRRVRLREACRHPLLGPELAFAFLDP